MLVQFILPLQMGFRTENSHKDWEWMGANSVLHASLKMLQLLHADSSGITWKHHIAYFCKWCIIRRRQVLSRFSQVHYLYSFFYRFTTMTSITCSLVGENHNCSDLSSFCLMSSPKAEMKMIAAPPPSLRLTWNKSAAISLFTTSGSGQVAQAFAIPIKYKHDSDKW